MHYSALSSDLEVVSALKRLFFVKKQAQSTPIKVTKQTTNNFLITPPSKNQPNEDRMTRASFSPQLKDQSMKITNRLTTSMNDSIRSPNSYPNPYPYPNPLITESTLYRTSEKNFLETEPEIPYYQKSTVSNYSKNLNKTYIQPQHQHQHHHQATHRNINRLTHLISPNQKKNQKENQNQIYVRRVSVDSFAPLKRNNNFISLTNPDEIIILDSKLSTLLSIILKGKNPSTPCCDLWSFYTNSFFLQNQEDFFNRASAKVIIRSASHLMILVIILSYDISFEIDLLIQLNMLFKTIFTLLQLNFLLIAKHVMSQMDQKNELINRFTQNLIQRLNGESTIEMNENELCNIIKHNCTTIVDLIKLILNNIQQPNETYKELMFNFYNLSQIETADLKEFFIKKIFRELMQSMRSILIHPCNFSYSYHNAISEPYLPIIGYSLKKQYTLCLGLDEVLISFAFLSMNSEDNKKGILHLRPGLINFLSKISEVYELVLFTSSTKGYTEPIMKAIEKNGKFFEYHFHREYCSLIHNECIKDLSKLGRDLSKVIIVDSNPESFKHYKDNGIIIQSFFGNELNDNALNKLLVVLMKIAKDKSESDIRQLLLKYHNDITQTISSSFLSSLKDNYSDLILIQSENGTNQQ